VDVRSSLRLLLSTSGSRCGHLERGTNPECALPEWREGSLVLTKSELIALPEKEVRILLHLATRIDSAALDYLEGCDSAVHSCLSKKATRFSYMSSAIARWNAGLLPRSFGEACFATPRTSSPGIGV
jgi:hypothetical protein